VSGEETKNPGQDSAEEPSDRTEVNLSYTGASAVVAQGDEERVALVTNNQRNAVSARGSLKDPIKVREALSVLHEIVGSDYRYVPKDRTAYTAYRQMRSDSSNLSAWAAQQAYFDWLSRNDPLAWLILDPVVSVHPDEVSFEVFSKDEGTYARLAVDWSAVELEAEPTFGTTNIDFSEDLFKGIQRMRSYRKTLLSVGGEDASSGDVALETEGPPRPCPRPTSASRPSTSTTCFDSSACTPTSRASPAASAWSWCPVRRRAWCSSPGRRSSPPPRAPTRAASPGWCASGVAAG